MAAVVDRGGWEETVREIFAIGGRRRRRTVAQKTRDEEDNGPGMKR